MPTYAYKCDHCHRRFERFLPMARYAEPQDCLVCGGTTTKQLFAPSVAVDYQGYTCPVTGKWIEGRRQHQENLKRTGCRVLESGEKEAVERAKAAEESAFERALDASVEEFFEKAPPEKLQQLERELLGGVTAQVTRTTPNP